jgi:two-component system, cell cycle sensor histidine kinase and response regulator CckA
VPERRLTESSERMRADTRRIPPPYTGPAVNGAESRAADPSPPSTADAAPRFRRLIEAVRDHAVIMLDATGRIVSWGEGARRMAGWQAADVLGAAFALLFPPESIAAEVPDRLLKRAETEGAVAFSGWQVTRMGDRIWAVGEIAAARDDRGRLLGFVVVGQDRTSRIRSEALVREREGQQRQAERLDDLGRLAAGLTHDFNNVLTAIGGFTRLLLDDIPAEDPRAELVREIDRARQRASEVTGRLAGFSRIGTAMPRRVDVNAVIRSLSPMLHRLLGDDVKLELALTEPAAAFVDPSQLEQVIVNLAVNARDALPRGGSIRIAAAPTTTRFPGRETDEPAIELTVADDGAGMAPEVQPRVFEPFFTTKSAGPATGLGLPLVAGIVAKAGGTVDLQSRAGRGTTIRIVLPRATVPDPEPIAGETAPALPHAPDRRRTILLAEADAGVRQLTRTLLDRQGFTVLEAASAEEALVLFEAEGGVIDLLITDAILPGMNGRMLADRVQTRSPGLPVLFVSGLAEDVLARRGVLEEGMALVCKPFTPGDLLVALARLVPAPD